jgi:hypothetical protein
MDNLRPRPSRLAYKDIGIPRGKVIHRIELYREKRVWYMRWRGKYICRYYALTDDAIYDISEVLRESK